MENGIHTFMKYKILRGKTRIFYSLRPVILFANVDISRYILVVDTSVLAKSNMDKRK
jgi:general stress protein CsbA